MKKLKKQLGEKDLSFAKPEELKEHLNLTPGSVSIFGLIYSSEHVTLLLDKQLWEGDIVGFHPNQNDATVEIDHSNLEKFYNSIVVEKQIVDLD